MARKSKSNTKVISIVLMVVGICLLVWAYQLSGSIGSQFSRTFTGSAPDKEMLLYIGGAVSLVLGLYIYFKK
jgi:predicted metal-binding membrane protein